MHKEWQEEKHRYSMLVPGVTSGRGETFVNQISAKISSATT